MQPTQQAQESFTSVGFHPENPTKFPSTDDSSGAKPRQVLNISVTYLHLHLLWRLRTGWPQIDQIDADDMPKHTEAGASFIYVLGM